MKQLVLLAVMAPLAGAQELKDFAGVFLSESSATYPRPVVLKIEQIPNGVKFTKYETYSVRDTPAVTAKTYILNGRYAKDAKEHSKTRAAFKKHKLVIYTVTERKSLIGPGYRKKDEEEWSLEPDLQVLTQRVRVHEQWIEMSTCGEEQDLCPWQSSRSTKTSERVYKRRGLLNAALAEAFGNN